MNLTDSIKLGILTDELDSDIPQNEVNEELLKNYDRNELYDSIEYRISQPYLTFLLQSTDKFDESYWDIILDRIAQIYSLNIAKIYEDGILSTKNISLESIKFLAYIKVRLIYHIENNKVNKNITTEELLHFLEKDEAPEIMIMCIKYIDEDSYKKFIDRIFAEVKMNYME